jgi:hypothetical protein
LLAQLGDQARESASWTQKGVAGDTMCNLFTCVAVLLCGEFKAGAVGLREHSERDGIATEETRPDCEFDVA